MHHVELAQASGLLWRPVTLECAYSKSNSFVHNVRHSMQGLLNGCKSDRLGTTSLANNCVFLLQPILGVLYSTGLIL